MVHSQGSTFAYDMANRYPDKIKAVIGIEPSGALNAASVDLSPLAKVPLLFVWGDKIAQSARWQSIQAPLKKMIAAVRDKGGRIDEIDLPARASKAIPT
jgi:pimeloyl-ACP methyl ester carboxylesterase